MNAAFEAVSTWRTETLTNSEKSLEQVTEKMAEAARALGWPEQVIDATRSQIQSITKMQMQTLDQIMVLGRSRSNHRTRHSRFCRSSSPSRALARWTLGQARPKWHR